MRRGGTALVVAMAAFAAGAAPASAAPPPLSKDHAPVRIDSSYGNGHFGSWQVDEFGLPTFRYSLDEAADARANQPEIYRRPDTTDAWHQVGNDHLQANAYNHGYVELWSQDRLMQWANRYDAANRHYAGGYGYLNVGGKVVSTLYADRPPVGSFERDFGVGYYRKRVAAEGLEVDQHTFAPFGDDPLLIDEVTITNTASTAKKASWFEYWDVNPYNQATQHSIGLGRPAYDPGTHTLAVEQVTAPEDLRRRAEGPGRRLRHLARHFLRRGRSRCADGRQRGQARRRDRGTLAHGRPRRPALRPPGPARSEAGPVRHAALRLRHGTRRQDRCPRAQVPRRRRTVPSERAALGRLGPEGELRRVAALGRA
jgi:hypothetical protein